MGLACDDLPGNPIPKPRWNASPACPGLPAAKPSWDLVKPMHPAHFPDTLRSLPQAWIPTAAAEPPQPVSIAAAPPPRPSAAGTDSFSDNASSSNESSFSHLDEGPAVWMPRLKLPHSHHTHHRDSCHSNKPLDLRHMHYTSNRHPLSVRKHLKIPPQAGHVGHHHSPRRKDSFHAQQKQGSQPDARPLPQSGHSYRHWDVRPATNTPPPAHKREISPDHLRKEAAPPQGSRQHHEQRRSASLRKQPWQHVPLKADSPLRLAHQASSVPDLRQSLRNLWASPEHELMPSASKRTDRKSDTLQPEHPAVDQQQAEASRSPTAAVPGSSDISVDFTFALPSPGKDKAAAPDQAATEGSCHSPSSAYEACSHGMVPPVPESHRGAGSQSSIADDGGSLHHSACLLDGSAPVAGPESHCQDRSGNQNALCRPDQHQSTPHRASQSRKQPAHGRAPVSGQGECAEECSSPRIQQEARVSVWLEGLGVDTKRLKQGHVNLLLDPLRNGLLLLYLAGHLRNAPCSSGVSHPTDMAAARRNIVTALLHLGLFDSEAGHSSGACLLQDVELMLQGQPRIVWSLLDHVRQHVSHHQPASPDPCSPSQHHSPAADSYQSVYLKHLSPRSKRPSPIPGQCPLPDRPNSPARAANVLAGNSPDQHQREHAACPVQWPQQHQYSHAPRSGSLQQRLPNTFPPSRQTRQAQEQLRQRNREGSQHYQPQPHRGSRSTGDNLHYLQALRPMSSPGAQGRVGSVSLLHPMSSPGAQGRVGSVSLQRPSQCSPMHTSNEVWHRSSIQSPAMTPFTPSRHDRLLGAPCGSISAQPHSPERDRYHQGRGSIVRAGNDGHSANIPGRKLSKEVGSSRKHFQTSSAQLRQALQQGQAGTVGGGLKKRPKPARPGLVEWLQQKGVDLGNSIRMEEAFADGILLCHLVQQRWHCQLAGVTWAHPSPAAARHNVTQALTALHDVPKMPLDNLWRASDIADATPGAVQALLHDLRHADARSH